MNAQDLYSRYGLKYGVYISNKTAKLKVLSHHEESDYLIVLDEGIKKVHPQLRMVLHEYGLKNCEYLGEL